MNKKIILVSAGVIALVIVASYGVIGGELTFLTPVDNDNITDPKIDTAPIDAADTGTLPASESSTAPIDDVDFGAALAFDIIENATIPADIAAANNAFAVDFYKQVATNNENVFFSPTSMYTAFSILYEGARHNTAEQIQQVFGMDPDREARHNATAHLMSSLNQDDPHATLELANSLWLAHNFQPHKSYLDVARGAYLADAEKVVFTGDGVNQINSWAENKTRGKIPKVLEPKDVNAKTVMVILNAIYFKGTWETQFPEIATKQAAFHINSERSIDADFMNVRGMFDYASSDGVKVLRLPYKGDRLSMLVILPDDINGIGQLHENLSSELLQKWNQDMIKSEIDLSLPKFETKTHYDLKAILSSLGMPDAFNRYQADLLGILGIPSGKYIDDNLFVDKALHDAYILVNEEGAEAAAVTTIGIMIIEEPPPPPRFIADHPFIFIIQDDKSGAILFMGAIHDPTKK